MRFRSPLPMLLACNTALLDTAEQLSWSGAEGIRAAADAWSQCSGKPKLLVGVLPVTLEPSTKIQLTLSNFAQCWWWGHWPLLQFVSCHLTLVSEVHLFSNSGMHAWTELLHLGWLACTQKVPVDFLQFMTWSQRRISGSRQSWNALQSCNFEDIRWRLLLLYISICRHRFCRKFRFPYLCPHWTMSFVATRRVPDAETFTGSNWKRGVVRYVNGPLLVIDRTIFGWDGQGIRSSKERREVKFEDFCLCDSILMLDNLKVWFWIQHLTVRWPRNPASKAWCSLLQLWFLWCHGRKSEIKADLIQAFCIIKHTGWVVFGAGTLDKEHHADDGRFFCSNTAVRNLVGHFIGRQCLRATMALRRRRKKLKLRANELFLQLLGQIAQLWSQFQPWYEGTLHQQEFQVPKMEVLNLTRLFWGWVFSYISLTYSLYRWVPPFFVPEMFGDCIAWNI